MKKRLRVKRQPASRNQSACPVLARGGEEGFVLVVALLALLVVTVLGVLALSTSTTEVMISGNSRLREINFSGAESGLEISEPIIKYTVYNQKVPGYAGVTFNTNLATGLRSGPANACISNALSFPFGSGSTVALSIAPMLSAPCEGAAMEFAAGYEGVGMGGGGSTCAYFNVYSASSGSVGSQSSIGGLYRYVSY